MKTRFIVILIFHTLCFHVFAQYFEGGMLAGLTASQMDGDMLGGYNKPGVTAGIWVGRNINTTWSYRAELKYTMKGAASNQATDLYSMYRKTLHYVELPGVIVYNFSSNLFAETGLSVAYLAHATLNVGNGTIDATEPMKRFELNILLGTAYRLTDAFTLSFRFSYSLFPVSRLPGNLTIWNTYAQYNNVLSLCVYYKVK